MIELVRLQTEHASKYFIVVKKWIDKLVEKSDGSYLTEDYKKYIESGVFQLWIIVEKDNLIGMGVTEIVKYPQYNICLIRVLATDTGKGLETVQTTAIEDWAVANNCKRIELEGRKGWLKVLDKVGWKPSPYIIMNKEIQND